MNRTTLALGLLLATTGGQAAETGVKGGSDYFAAGISSDKRAASTQYAIEYSRGYRASHLVDASVGYGFMIGALSVTPRIGAFQTDASQNDHSAEGFNAGVRLMAPVPLARSTWLYMDYSLSPDFANHNLHALHQFEAGVTIQPARWLSFSSGYRYIASDGDYGLQDRTLADGLFIGAAWRF